MTYKEKIAKGANKPEQSFLSERKNRFSERLKIVMKGEPNLPFAKKVGLTETTIRRYLADGSVPNLDVLEQISEATGYEVGWLASGKGPMLAGEREEERTSEKNSNSDGVIKNQYKEIAPLDSYTLQKVIEAVEMISDNMDKPLKPEKKSKIISALYEHCVRVDSMDPKFVKQIVDLAS